MNSTTILHTPSCIGGHSLGRAVVLGAIPAGISKRYHEEESCQGLAGALSLRRINLALRHPNVGVFGPMVEQPTRLADRYNGDVIKSRPQPPASQEQLSRNVTPRYRM